MPEAKKRILHVDDDKETLDIVRTILEKEGYEVDSIMKGEEALEHVKLDGYDLLLLDIMMPDISGWDLFTRISKLKKEHKVVFLTVLRASPEKLRQFQNYGVRDYITKPFDRNDLLGRVKKALSEPS